MFKRAKEGTSHVSSVHVSWTCSAEFDANEKKSISFIEDEAYIILAKPAVQTGERYTRCLIEFLSFSISFFPVGT